MRKKKELLHLLQDALNRAKNSRKALIADAVYNGLDNAPKTAINAFWRDCAPSHWHLTKLRYLLRTGLFCGMDAYEVVPFSNYPVLTQKSVQWGGMDYSWVRYAPDVDFPLETLRAFLYPYDVVMNSDGTGTLGRAGVIDREGLVAHDKLCVMRFNLNKVNPYYLVYMFETDQFQTYLYNTYVIGATGQIHLRMNKLNDIPFYLPELDEQHRIVLYLDTILPHQRALVTQISKLIEHLKHGMLDGTEGTPEELQWWRKYFLSNAVNEIDPMMSIRVYFQMEPPEVHTVFASDNTIAIVDDFDMNVSLQIEEGEPQAVYNDDDVLIDDYFVSQPIDTFHVDLTLSESTEGKPSTFDPDDVLYDLRDLQQEMSKFVPEDPVTYTRLKHFIEPLRNGKTPLGGSDIYVDRDENSVLFIRSQNVYFEGLRLEDAVYIPRTIHEAMPSSHVYPGDVLLNITGSSIGRCGLVPDDIVEANINQHIMILRGRNVEQRYLYYQLASQFVQNQVWSMCIGASREAVTMDQIENLQIKMMSLSDQKRFCDMLDTQIRGINASVFKAQQALSFLEMRWAMMIDEALAQYTDRNQMRFREIADITPHILRNHLSGDYPVTFITMQDTTIDQTMQISETRLVKDLPSNPMWFMNGDILVPMMNSFFTEGYGCIVKGLTDTIACGSKDMFVFRPKNGYTSEYVYYLLRGYQFRHSGTQFMEGANWQQRVQSRYVMNYRFPVLSTDEQSQLVEQLDQKFAKNEAAKDFFRRYLAWLNTNRIAILSRAFENLDVLL
jgi:type I restriction enzyme, S subunit